MYMYVSNLCMFLFPGVQFHPGEVANFQSIAHRSIGSPSEAVIQDFITRGLTTDDVYLVLQKMGHKAGMKVLQDHGKY